MSEETKELDAKARELQPDIARAERAKAIIEDPMVAQAFEDIENSCLDGFKASGPDQVDLRENCHRLYLAIGMFQDIFKKHLDTGKMANISLLEINQRKKTIKERMFG